MPLKHQIESYARKIVERRPGEEAVRRSVRPRPDAMNFEDDGIVPNNPRFPLVTYRGAVNLTEKQYDVAAMIDALFELNGWGRSFRRDTISQLYRSDGRGAWLGKFGGVKGRHLKLKAGDVAVVPAGAGHRLIASRDFLVVGAYPEEDWTYDECTDTRDRVEASKRIAKTGRPQADPVYGSSGPLKALWAVKKS